MVGWKHLCSPEAMSVLPTASEAFFKKHDRNVAADAIAISTLVQPLVFNTLGAMYNEVYNFMKGMA